jgi:hypothetical protein
MMVGFHAAEILVLAIICGLLACLVAGVIIFAQLARGAIRHEVRRTRTEQHEQDRVG